MHQSQKNGGGGHHLSPHHLASPKTHLTSSQLAPFHLTTSLPTRHTPANLHTPITPLLPHTPHHSSLLKLPNPPPFDNAESTPAPLSPKKKRIKKR